MPIHRIEAGAARPAPEALRLGLINNMPEAAFEATEQQFVSLLGAAASELGEGDSGARPIMLELFALPGMAPATRCGSRYAGAEALWAKRLDEPDGLHGLDGLIITGREPLSADLRDEPYWPSFAAVVDWAREHTRSTVFSCLAAHAAVLHADSIERRRRPGKHFGVFACEPVAAHPLLAGLPSTLSVPHSRWNGLAAHELAAHGYQVLTATRDGGSLHTEVDLFVKDTGHSLFVYLQGHPEYSTDTLLREYRRDAVRFVRGQLPAWPGTPHGYFLQTTDVALAALRLDAEATVAQPGAPARLLARLAAILDAAEPPNTWRPTAERFYRNWLSMLAL